MLAALEQTDDLRYWFVSLCLPVDVLEKRMFLYFRVTRLSISNPLLDLFNQNLANEVDKADYDLLVLHFFCRLDKYLVVENFLPNHAFAGVKKW